MPLTTQGRNDLLTNGLTAFTHASALTDLGTTEATGVTRQAITWAAASGGQRSNSAQLSIPVGSSATPVVAASIHSALSAGNMEGWFQIGSTLRGAASVDAIATDLIQSDGHGLVADDRVFVTAIGGDALPAGLSASTLYFVLASGLATDAFKVSTTSGGTAVDITTLSELAWFKTVPQTFPTGGNLVVAASALVMDLTYV